MNHDHGTKELTNLKGIVSAYDNALFLWHDVTGNLMAIHADNFVYCENDLFLQNLIAELKKYSKLECMKAGYINFLGLGVRQMKDGITINQNLYVSSISPTDIKN